MPYEIDIVVTSNIPKDLGPDIEVVVGLPAKDPWSLGFAHKPLFAERLENYDLFIYSEDDVLITKRNIDAFLSKTKLLREDEIASFFLVETGADGKHYFPQVRQHYRWEPKSLRSRGGETFASFTNEHAACYLLTQGQLRRAMASGGFLVKPHEGRHDLLCAAATDPYTQCGFKPLVCISRFEDFLVAHLPNKYYSTGLIRSEADFNPQLEALRQRNGNSDTAIFPIETRVYRAHWSKSYYEPPQTKMLSLVPSGAKSVLSIGCGWGATEEELIKRGIRVKGIPLDSLIAACAEARGVEIVYGDLACACEKLRGESFDCLLLSNVLHLVRDPTELLISFAKLVAPGGCIIASMPNLPWVRRMVRRLRLRGHAAVPRSYQASGMHVTNERVARHWFRQAGLRPTHIVYDGSKKSRQLSGAGLDKVLGSDVYISAVREGLTS